MTPNIPVIPGTPLGQGFMTANELQIGNTRFLAELSCRLHICLYVTIIWKTKKLVRAFHCISVILYTLPGIAKYNYRHQVIDRLS